MDAAFNGSFDLAELQRTIRRSEGLGFALTGFASRDEKMHVGDADFPSNLLHYELVPAPPAAIECVSFVNASGAATELAKRQSSGWDLVAFGTLYVKSKATLLAAFRHS